MYNSISMLRLHHAWFKPVYNIHNGTEMTLLKWIKIEANFGDNSQFLELIYKIEISNISHSLMKTLQCNIGSSSVYHGM